MNQTELIDSPVRADRWSILTLAAIGTFMATLDISILNVALPTLVSALKTTVATSQWFVLSYNFVITILLMTFGRLGDLIGRRKLYIGGVLLFILGSLTCGLSTSALMLIIARAIQGAGASITMSGGPALVTEAFPAKERGKAFGLVGTSVALGLLTGPMIGGLIIQHISWRWIFFVNMPIGLLLMYLIYTRVHGYDTKRPGKLDLGGAALMSMGVACLLFGLTFGDRLGWTSLSTIALFTGALVFLMAFILLELKIPNPMLDLELFKNREFSIGAFTGWTNYAAMTPIWVFLPFYLQKMLKYDPQHVGFILASGPLTLAIVAPIAGTLSDKIGSRFLTTVGLLAVMFGLLSMRSLHGNSSWFDVVWRIVLASFGSALFVSPNSSSVMGSVESEKLGVASGVVALVRNLGMVFGIALAGAIIFSVQSSFHVTGEVAKEPIMQDYKFMHGLIAAFLACAVIAFAGAFMSALRVRPGDEEKWERMG